MALLGNRFNRRRSGAGAEVQPSSVRRSAVGPVQILTVAAVVIAALFFSRAPSKEDVLGAEGSTSFGRAAPPPVVRVIQPTSASTALMIVTTGSVNVRNHVGLSPQITGRVAVVSPNLRAGESFAAGEELLVIDPSDFELAVEQAQADVESAESTLLLQQAEGDAARLNYAILHPGEAVPPLVARVPQIEQARARVASARARAKVAALELSRTRFSLPFAGRVTEAAAEAGQLLTKGQSFGKAFALDAVQAVGFIGQDDLRRISPAVGRRASVRAGSTVLPASVERVSAELDERTRFARVFLSFDEVPELPPGTFVDIEIEGPSLANTLTLPEAAEQVGAEVWIVDGGRLDVVRPTVLGRDGVGIVVDAFDYADGVVIGAVPGARRGLSVVTAGPDA
ncbi:MAG: efflux RND transporter periplasmic adaptor subunit [Gammaproteobacteria bacterium]|nr:efflux RND transporter periplasmic adaptor subunit [Gammaproteobacteria bacterium]